jgi:heat shock protein HslJ
MTKSQSFYYISAVAVIILLAYIYTTVVHAPEDNTMKDGEMMIDQELNETDSLEVTDSVPPDLFNSLSGTNWLWEYTETMDKGPLVKPKQADAFILSFDSSGRIGSQTDCNSLGGKYKVSGDSIIISEMISTMMFCEDSDEAIYSQQLSQVESFTQEADSLRLNLKNGAGAMVFGKTTF